MVPINDTLYGALKSIPVHMGTDLVFPGISGFQLRMAFRKARKRAEIKVFCIHDLRREHTFVNNLTRGGVI